jgi:hypothetical protein
VQREVVAAWQLFVAAQQAFVVVWQVFVAERREVVAEFEVAVYLVSRLKSWLLILFFYINV